MFPYSTNYPTYASGRFSGPLVVTMRPVKKKELDGVYAICSQFSHAHGAPIFHGNPRAIGIEDLSKPDYGDAVEVRDDEVPVFWACGVTTQEAISFAKPPICITHAPGHMLIADVKSRSLPNIVDNTRDFFESFASSSGF